MKAFILNEICQVDTGEEKRKIKSIPLKSEPLDLVDIEDPKPSPGQVLIKVTACGVCHTELDEIEGRRHPILPVVPGHEVVGIVESTGVGAKKYKPGDRVGVAWIFNSCGKCHFCLSGNENLCDDFMATGCDANGGYAQYMVVREDFAYKIPERFTDSQGAPLLCAGAVGYRALKLTEMQNGETLGLFGFGASAHIVIQISRHLYPDSKVYVFTRSEQHQKLAIDLGAFWAGEPDAVPPDKINRAIDFTPVGETITRVMKILEKGGKLAINAIRKRTPIILDYTDHLWCEKDIKSVANITRKDVEEFLPLSAKIPIVPEVQEFKMEDANKALVLLKQGKIQGAGVLRM